MEQKIALVTGGTSGIGLATAQALRQKGYRVYEFSRRAEGADAAIHLQVDITKQEQVDHAVGQILAQEGRIDVVINNAGFGISGAMEFTPVAEAQREFDVMVFGMMRVNRAVLPVMRQAGRGRIVNISSVAAVVPIPFQACYSAAKAAVNAYTMALANEVRPFGIQVCCVQPGDIATGFTAAREKNQLGDAVYQGRISRSVAKMEHDEQTGMSAQTAGQYIACIATRRRVKPISTIGFSYRCDCLLVRLLPASFSNWLVGRLYGG